MMLIRVISLFYFLSIGYSNLFSQTLVFKQAILVESQTETVPANHVWKITSVNVGTPVMLDANNASSGTMVNANRFCISINSSTLCGGESSMAMTSASSVSGVRFTRDIFHGPLQMPIWLPAGSTVSTSTGTQLISVLEFEITQ